MRSFLETFLILAIFVLAFLALASLTWLISGGSAIGLDWFSHSVGLFWGAVVATLLANRKWEERYSELSREKDELLRTIRVLQDRLWDREYGG